MDIEGRNRVNGLNRRRIGKMKMNFIKIKSNKNREVD